jgi:hypothetical protein
VEIHDKEASDRAENLKKARKKLFVAVHKAKKELTTKGIQAWKDDKAKVARLQAYEDADELPLPKDLLPIREPDKRPTIVEFASCVEGFHPRLKQAVEELENSRYYQVSYSRR